MTRFKAAGIHLLISAAVIGAFAVFYLTQWYPPALLEMSKGLKLLGLLALVDVVVGPLLTFLVFKPGKKGLKFDLTVIAVLQLAALAYGLHSMWQSRPVFMVAVKDRFELVFANEIHPKDLSLASPEFQRLGWGQPRLLSAPLPEDPVARERVMLSAFEGRDVHRLPEHYRPYEDILPELRRVVRPASSLPEPALIEQATRVAVRNELGINDVGYVPINSSRGAAVMLIRRSDGQPLEPLNWDPWE